MPANPTTDFGEHQTGEWALAQKFATHYLGRHYPDCHELLASVPSPGQSREALTAAFAETLPGLSSAFREALRDPSPGASVALEYLRYAGDAGADFLLDWLAEEEDKRIRSRIIGFTEAIHPRSLFSQVEKRLDDPRWFVVRNMVTITGRLNPPQAAEFMSRAIRNTELRVAKEVVKALFKSPSPSSAPLVIALLEHDDKSIRLQALRLVTVFGLEKSGAAQLLQKLALRDPVPEVRTLASSILG